MAIQVHSDKILCVDCGEEIEIILYTDGKEEWFCSCCKETKIKCEVK